jgi:hypothetical protein
VGQIQAGGVVDLTPVWRERYENVQVRIEQSAAKIRLIYGASDTLGLNYLSSTLAEVGQYYQAQEACVK